MLNLKEVKVGFIGFGNMAQAMADGFLYTGTLRPDQICACAGNYEKLQENAGKREITSCRDSAAVADWSDVIVVAVKPWMVEDVLTLAGQKLDGKMIISVAADCLFEVYEKILPPGSGHISTIPNTPVSIGEGVIVCENRHSFTEEEYVLVKELLSGIGRVVEVPGSQVDIASTVSGCGPAFASMFMEALADAGVMYGLSRKTAYELAGQMTAGTGKLLAETGKHPGEMKDDVCSPGGTTIAGVAALENKGFRAAVIEAVRAVMGKYGQE